MPPGPCIQAKACWLWLGEIGDSVSVALNGTQVVQFSDPSGEAIYIKNQSILIPLPSSFFVESINRLQLSVTDFDGTLAGMRSKVEVGFYSDLLWKARFDFIARVGSSWLSAFALLLCTFAFGAETYPHLFPIESL